VVNYESVLIKGNHLSGADKQLIRIEGDGVSKVSRTYITGNTLSNAPAGINLTNSSGTLIENNSFAAVDMAVKTSAAENAVFANNTISILQYKTEGQNGITFGPNTIKHVAR
jgi:parallel beta-helix repeat protein